MTQIIGVIGDPIEHSLSPLMQTAALQAAGIDATYRSFHVTADDLAAFVQEVRDTPYLGFNITIPHKQSIRQYLDRLMPEAEAIGAVNTVHHIDGKLIGYNTDATGYLRSLNKEQQWQAADKIITLLGAGGAARAVAYGLQAAGAKRIFLVNRTAAKATALASEVSVAQATEWSSLPSCLDDSDLLVNATSVGMGGTAFDNLPLASLPKHALVSDLVYTPRETPLLRSAKERGLQTHEGLGMLVYQGAEAFKIWFGQEPDVKVMRTALEKALD